MTFAVDEAGAVLGWANYAGAPAVYQHLSLSCDSLILLVPAAPALAQLKFLRSEIEEGYRAINVRYSRGTLRFHITRGGRSSSLPIDVSLREGAGDVDFECDVRLEQLIELFSNAKARDVELRIVPLITGERSRSQGLRTIDEFSVDDEGKVLGDTGAQPPPNAMKCRVERFCSNIMRGGA